MPEDQLEGRGRSVLVVDGHAAALDVLRKALEGRGYEVEAVTDAAQALGHLDRGTFDVIIAETRIPDMDGFAFLEQLRRRPDTAETPFIFFSGDHSPESKVRALGLGVDEYTGTEDYITKPCVLDEFFARLAAVVRRRQAALALAFLPGGPLDGWDMSGKLSLMGLGEILQELAMGAKTGMLRVSTSSGPGDIYLSKGEVYHAFLEGGAQGVEVVQWLATIREGTFDFRAGETASEKSIDVPTSGLLLQIANVAAGDG